MQRLQCWMSLLAFVTLPVAAQEGVALVTVEDLRDTCRSALDLKEQLSSGGGGEEPTEIISTLRCVSFVEGVVATVVRLGAGGFMLDPLYDTSFCFPDGTTSTDWVGKFVEWADSRPDQLQMSSVDGLLLALIETYPCDTEEDSEEGTPGL